MKFAMEDTPLSAIFFVKKLSAHAAAGYLPGMQQPALVAQLTFAPADLDAQDLLRLDALLHTTLNEAPWQDLPPAINAHPLLKRIVSSTFLILQQGGIPVFSNSTFFGAEKGTIMHLALPVTRNAYGACNVTLDWVIELINASLNGTATNTLTDSLPALVNKIRKVAPHGMNSLRFIEAAQAACIPLQHVADNVYRFGWGARSCSLNSSFSDRTPLIAAQLARDKMATAQVLRQFRVPVPEHALVDSPEQAVLLAGQMTYPVVVKPADQDGGRGVASGLKTEDEVRRAYAHARTLSGRILLEKHFEGNDYRLQVFQNRVIWATHRVPGGVTGDGVQSVTQLLATLNANPLRGSPASNATLKQIALDEEALELLAAQSLTADAVPSEAQFVRLRRNANVASGGVPLPVLDVAHPDNLALAIRATRALGLDIAGVDLLIPDIRRSWLESGAAVCEVNAQPQMYPHLPAYLLGQLVQGEGRIPVSMVLGEPPDAAWLAELENHFCTLGRCVGIATQQGIRINGELVSGPCNAFEGTQALLADTSIDAVIVLVADTQMLNTGCAVDRLDLLALLAPPATATQGMMAKRWEGLARTLAPRAGAVVLSDDAPFWHDAAQRMAQPPRVLAAQNIKAELSRITKEE